MALLPISERQLDRAVGVDPPNVRSLDAIHLATAISWRPGRRDWRRWRRGLIVLHCTCYDVHVSFTRRTQVLLDEERYRRLRDRADAEGVSVGAFVRGAVDRALAEDHLADARRAAEAFLDAEPLPVGEPAALERELERSYER